MNVGDSKYRLYLYDLGDILKTRALEAKRERDKTAKDSEEYCFQTGRLVAFNEVISVMQQQAEGFGILLKELQIDEIIPDRDLV